MFICFTLFLCNYRTQCVNHKCLNYNEKVNIYNTGREFTTFLLPNGCPSGLSQLVDTIVEGFKHASINSEDLLKLMTQVVDKFRSGQYLTGGHSNSKTGNNSFQCLFFFSKMKSQDKILKQYFKRNTSNSDKRAEIKAFLQIKCSASFWIICSLIIFFYEILGTNFFTRGTSSKLVNTRECHN